MAVEMVTYPFVAGEKGIPFAQLLELSLGGKKSGEFTAESGRRMEYLFDDSSISITDHGDETFVMGAAVDEGVAEFVLITRRLNDRQRHPDMFAAEFVGFALMYLEEMRKHVTSIVDIWEQPSDNYKQFFQTYNISHDIVGAARSTWPGRTYARFGFVNIEEADVILPQDPMGPVWATFSKPTLVQGKML
ncbi:MAG: hypothetical protein A3C30_04675 [Candidatus Levybacteria bacterium RIFCSPHIGHO2_02_FULL_40_18]|nr:MAG: hypothetical protein A2869_02330 [Candidatus Levybacteria bacterium RIFCSPHIGHO2_01_FULL_40_58]OGH26373.1 MAG: hypothetical protein A3C30_04675 [Candidatus Levybacteria bacterium RIFCSPHIGHO2_02_FULL_40_18]OGH31820.1 MAG: hypothetical protein A3E43_00470 [Candidatus Levybacteria bacterium RIFCSPHIGHO2_12_FULL_40_31]OGH40453.1 MAG: hypothetical protein A2894_00975 [Candidatus Levybacteria bacterium RIFCSPLOWO2_01_FULL_40_64]OGH49160.1 MAG: hypothetical protein A3I54_04375 [Candidatus Lev